MKKQPDPTAGFKQVLDETFRARLDRRQTLNQQPGTVTKGKKQAIETDTATYPFWAINVSAMEIFAHDRHGRQVGPAEKVRDLQEAHDICEARNYPGRKG